ncbi:MarR family winged helix-turn-helix transcriptional regulator [Ruicaihuangia caeni]|uniref:MarR family transcriptional regulator n=1 Tax=Ruicaihuangia caeni TaxID=3042517 RepID=A0AAW6TCZ5_9MICO|nr:MarR family transcriptional regulator [Klugiella sp. YN-L-19]MDI2098942.1 MarR family transcriptional regulator [Klugiella sp. YN-L-19]
MTDRALAVDAWEALFRAQVVVMRELNAEFPDENMSLNEYDVLFNLSRQPDRRARIRDLNRMLFLTQPSVSRLLDRLVTRGFVTKSPDPKDGRGTIVALTDTGYERFRAAAAEHSASISAHLGNALDAGELQRLRELCDKLRKSVEPN